MRVDSTRILVASTWVEKLLFMVTVMILITYLFFKLEDICKDYGYKTGDLMYFKELDKTLIGGLHLISVDDEVLFMVGCYKRKFIVHLYVVCFGEGQDDVEEYDEEEE